MAVINSLVPNSAEWDLSLPLTVRQMLRLTGSSYELDRQSRYSLNSRYYKNTAYQKEFLAADSVESASETQRKKQLWNGIKPLYNVITHAVDTDKQLCFKKARPLPVRHRGSERNKNLEERLTQKWETGGWGLDIKDSPFFGAKLGDSYLRVIPGALDGNPNAPSRLAVHSPEIMTVLRDQHHHHRITAAKIEYMYTEPRDVMGVSNQSWMAGALYSGLPEYNIDRIVGLSNEELHRFTMIITEEAYWTFRDHALYAYPGNPKDDNGNPLNSWPNTLGIVPVIAVPFKDIKEDMGLSTFDSILPTIDSVNELASMFGQDLKMHVDRVLVAYGFNSNAKFEKVLNSDGSTVFYVPFPPQFGNVSNANQPRLEFLESKGEGSAPLMKFLEMVVEWTAAVMPESLYHAKSQRQGSGYEASLDMQPLVDKMEGIREVQFPATERVMQLALVADDIRGMDLSQDEVLDRIDTARTEYDLFIWSEPVLPQDKATTAQTRSVELANNIISERTARLERGMTYVEADDEEEQLEEEHKLKLRWAKELAQVQAEFGPKAQIAGPKAKGAGAQPTPPTKKGDNSNAFNNPKGGVQPRKRLNNPRDNR